MLAVAGEGGWTRVARRTEERGKCGHSSSSSSGKEAPLMQRVTGAARERSTFSHSLTLKLLLVHQLMQLQPLSSPACVAACVS